MTVQRIRFAKMLTAAILTSIAAPVFAEAPVFDVDAVQQQQFETAAEQGQDLPPPPAPAGQEPSTFVPLNSGTASSSNSAPAVSHAPVTSSMNTTQRLRRIEQQLANVQVSENASHIEALQEQVQSLRGQVEQLMHQLERVQTQQKAMYSDLDKRVSDQSGQSGDKNVKRALAAGVSDNAESPLSADTATDKSASKNSDANKAPKIAAAKSSIKTIVGANPSAPIESTKSSKVTDQPDDAEEQAIYQTAYNLIKVKKYNEAVDALQGMLKKYPSGQFASNAHYWLGELYGLMSKNDLALSEFKTVISTFPDSPRVSDAQLKIGLIYSAQSKWTDAKTSFKKVINVYPGTASARVASEQLKQIKTAGH